MRNWYKIEVLSPNGKWYGAGHCYKYGCWPDAIEDLVRYEQANPTRLYRITEFPA